MPAQSTARERVRGGGWFEFGGSVTLESPNSNPHISCVSKQPCQRLCTAYAVYPHIRASCTTLSQLSAFHAALHASAHHTSTQMAQAPLLFLSPCQQLGTAADPAELLGQKLEKTTKPGKPTIQIAHVTHAQIQCPTRNNNARTKPWIAPQHRFALKLWQCFDNLMTRFNDN